MNEIIATGGYWPANQAVTPGTATATYPSVTTYWPQAFPQPAPQPMVNGWRCGDCQTVMAPWMPTHKCIPTTAANTLTNTVTASVPATISHCTVTGTDILNKAGDDAQDENT
jgi:hypothetical protein